ncbi:MAG: type II secretion system major pseudopilin GspG [Acidobacteria bacterium]|nr:type II secretion system major pseudopilin GspG [Acidobacteriota bacterium]
MLKLRRNKREKGFSLIELIVVLVILGLLAAVVGPAVMRRLKGSRTQIAKIQISQFEESLDLFNFDVGRYPGTQEGLQALIQNSGNVPNWSGPYLKKNALPKDPWGHDYVYRSPGQHGEYDLYSLGADGQEGGDGENADVSSWAEAR